MKSCLGSRPTSRATGKFGILKDRDGVSNGVHDTTKETRILLSKACTELARIRLLHDATGAFRNTTSALSRGAGIPPNTSGSARTAKRCWCSVGPTDLVILHDTSHERPERAAFPGLCEPQTSDCQGSPYERCSRPIPTLRLTVRVRRCDVQVSPM